MSEMKSVFDHAQAREDAEYALSDAMEEQLVDAPEDGIWWVRGLARDLLTALDELARSE